MMMVEVIWEEPPRLTRRAYVGRQVWTDRLAPLMEGPGRWAMVHTYKTVGAAASTASQLRRGMVVSVPTGTWEFAARGPKVYARYLGEA